jgi:hypothetical protein
MPGTCEATPSSFLWARTIATFTHHLPPLLDLPHSFLLLH